MTRSPTTELFHGTRMAYASGDPVLPDGGFAYLSPNLDAAIWAAELAEGGDVPRVYVVATTGEVERAEEHPGYTPLPHPAMTHRSRARVTVLHEVSEWRLYHGTRADLQPGDVIEPGHLANYGPTSRLANFVYFAQTLDAAIWGAELAAGDGRERIYLVETSGAWEDDPNVTNKRFRGNPTRSYRSSAPLRVVGDVESWVPHPPDQVRAMREGLARLERAGVEPIDD